MRVPGLSIVVLFLVALAVPPAAAESAPSHLQLVTTRLSLEARLDVEGGSITGRLGLTVENAGDHFLTEVPLLLNRLMVLSRAHDASGRPLAFRQDVVTFSDWPERQVNQATVDLPGPLGPGERTLLVVDYSGILVGATETGMLYVRDHIDEEFSILREEALAFPVVGLPSAEVNASAPRRDFDYRISITAPHPLVVASGGTLIDRIRHDGVTTWTYESRGPAPFLNIPIAPYETLEEQGVKVFHFPDDAGAASVILERTHAALDLLAEWFGPLGGEASLSIMEIPEGWGSQASLTAGILQTADAFRDPNRLTALYHELSHLWNAPDLERPSARWNEGLATFLQYKLADSLSPSEPGRRFEAVERTARRLLERVASDTAARSTPFRCYGDQGLTGLSYSTGFVMFHLLHELVGEEAFNQIVGGHYQSHQETGGSFEDLMERARDATPIDLDTFFSEWVETTDWQSRLEASGSVDALLEWYRRPT